ncbi:MAG: exosortase-associated EpsI family protein [Planctomycetota bacterium]|nr:exosortase-associated EpsI family protein [Planctomycetota bacterium]MDA1177232.1 exosortase-associated EpsI family protein [Planctomycetota bacterium]
MSDRPTVYILLAVIVTITSATLHGRLVGRWTSQSALATLGQELAGLPTTLGSWYQVATNELPKESVKMLQCSAHQHRTYRDSVTGATMDLIIVLGPPGPTSVHIPEICYPSQNYKIVSQRSRKNFSDKRSEQLQDSEKKTSVDEFWKVTFKTNDVAAKNVQVYYGWSQGERWEAPEQPRFHYSGSPWLYKLQLATSSLDDASQRDTERFFQELLPQLRDHMQTKLTSAKKSNQD